ncbi:MAG: hypothetical protein JWN79_1289 [Gemmatimonadetes bacterium]|jgi:hypothetical protein|nr:hypothetical protein [Gemmatimonadota bacterium]
MRLLALRAETMQAMRRLKLPCDDITPIGLWGSDMFLIGVNNDQFEVLRLWNVQTEDVTPATLRDLHSDSPAIPTSPSAGNAASGARSPARKGAPFPASASPTPSSEQSEPARAASPAPASPAVGAASPSLTVEQDNEPELIDAGAARGRNPLEIQPAFEAVAQAPAPEAPSTRTPGASSSSSGRAANGSAGTASVTPAAASSERRDGPDLKLESSAPSSTSRSSRSEEGRASKAPRGDTQLKPAAKEAAKDTGSNAGKLRMTVDGEHLYAEIKGGKIVLKDRTYDSLAHARDSIRRERNKVAVWEYFDEGVKAWRVLNRD